MRNKVTLWTSWANIFLGFWLIVSPTTFSIQGEALIWSDLICGGLLVVLGFFTRSGTSVFLPWLGALIGVWLQAAPLLFWTKDSACYLNDTLVGVLAMTFFVILPTLPGGVADEGPEIPPGWSYNPSSWAQRLPIILLAGFCWFGSRYLTAYQLGFIDEVWDPFFDPGTEAVLTSKVSQLFPISDAGLGAMAYTLEFLFACQGGERRWRTSPWMSVLSGIFIVPVSLVSVILVILQPLSVGAWCSICLLIAFCALLSVPLGIDELVLSLQYLKRSKEKKFWKLCFEGGKCPQGHKDHRTPSCFDSLKEQFSASLWGISFPKNLLGSTVIGAWLMLTPFFFQTEDLLLRQIDYIAGPCAIVISVISTAELLRGVRWINGIISILLLFFFLIHGADFNHYLIAFFLALFSVSRGSICERSQFIP